jgi:hypothetical protein
MVPRRRLGRMDRVDAVEGERALAVAEVAPGDQKVIVQVERLDGAG